MAGVLGAGSAGSAGSAVLVDVSTHDEEMSVLVSSSGMERFVYVGVLQVFFFQQENFQFNRG